MLYNDLRGVIFLEKKIINAMKLTEAYDNFRILVDPMNNWSHELEGQCRAVQSSAENLP